MVKILKRTISPALMVSTSRPRRNLYFNPIWPILKRKFDVVASVEQDVQFTDRERKELAEIGANRRMEINRVY